MDAILDECARLCEDVIAPLCKVLLMILGKAVRDFTRELNTLAWSRLKEEPQMRGKALTLLKLSVC